MGFNEQVTKVTKKDKLKNHLTLVNQVLHGILMALSDDNSLGNVITKIPQGFDYKDVQI